MSLAMLCYAWLVRDKKGGGSVGERVVYSEDRGQKDEEKGGGPVLSREKEDRLELISKAKVPLATRGVEMF